jgi:hypothetical protein
MFSWKVPYPASRRAATLIFVSLSALSLATAFPPAPTSEPAAVRHEHERTADRFVKEKLRLWQERLNLMDWNIQVKLVRNESLEPKTLGNIHWDTDTKQATIAVLSTYDYNLPFQAMLDDMEFTVVHELVHLHLASLPRSDASRRIEEHAVNELARALIRLAKP